MSSTELVSAYVALKPRVENFGRDTEAQLGGGLNSIGKKLGANLGKAIAAGGAVVAALGIAKGLSSSTDAFKDLSLEVIQFQRVTGGSAKDASRLRFAIHESGVDVAKATTAFGIFDKKLGAAAGNQKKTATLVGLLGRNFTDAKGQILPMSQILPGVADKFAAMPDGIQKAALASQLFGKSGVQLLPFLNKGAAGIGELTKKSDELGLTLGQKQVDSFKKYRAAGRELSAVFEGLKVQIGAKLLPIVTQFTEFITQQVSPGIAALIGYVKQSPVFAQLGAVIGTVLGKIGSATQTVIGLVLPVLQTYARTFTTVVVPAIASLVSYLVGKFGPVIAQVFGIVTTQVLPILVSFAKFIYGSVVPAIVAIVSKVLGNLKPAFEAIVNYYQSAVLPAIQKVLAKFREWQPTIQVVVLAIVKVIGKIAEFASLLLGKLIPILAKVAGFIVKVFVGTVVKAFDLVFNACKKVVTFLLKGFGTIVTTFGKVLSALGRVPGFGWAKTAAQAMKNAGQAAVNLANDINAIPREHQITILITQAIRKAVIGPGGDTAAALAAGGFKGGGVKAPKIPQIKIPTLGGGGGSAGSGGGGGAGGAKDKAKQAAAEALKAAKAARAQAKKLLAELTVGVKQGGEKLQKALEDIRSHIADLPKGIRAPLRAMVNTFSAQLASLTTQLNAAKDKLASIQSSYADLASTIASAFNPSDLFSAGLDELRAKLDAGLANVKAALQAQSVLLAAGVSGAFLNSLLASGNGALAASLSENTDLARQLGREYDQIQQQAAQLGDAQAQATYNPQIAATNLLIQKLSDKIDALAGQISKGIGGILKTAIASAFSKSPSR